MPDQIQKRALETWYTLGHQLYADLQPSVMGLVGEAGELIDYLKKMLFKPGFNPDWSQFDDELGDVLYYVSIIAHQRGMTLDELSQRNYAKLLRREWDGTGYNRGKEMGQNEAADLTNEQKKYSG